MLEWLHPMRASRYVFCETFNPWMRGIAMLAEVIDKSRQPLSPGNPLIEREREVVGNDTELMEKARQVRDAAFEQAFSLRYGGSTRESPRDD